MFKVKFNRAPIELAQIINENQVIKLEIFDSNIDFDQSLCCQNLREIHYDCDYNRINLEYFKSLQVL